MGRMDEQCAPKQLLFGELVKRRPFHGPKKKWRDEVMNDLCALGGTSCARIAGCGQSGALLLLML